jgi:hypothetical protein
MARSLEDVKKSHGPKDYSTAMKAALAGIPPGKYETTMELCYRAGLTTKQIPSLQPQFEAHAVAIKNTAGKLAWMWARTPADAKKLRDALKSQNG